MLLLTVKHVIADFMLQNSWMAIGKDQKTGWALPLLAHCLVHLAVSLALILATYMVVYARVGMQAGLAILVPPGQALDAAVASAERLSQAATTRSAGEDNRPATALLLYGGFIVIGSVVGVGLARRVQRELP